MQWVKEAEDLARKLHAGQTRRDGSPYIEHPARMVAEMQNAGISDPKILASAWLHDVLEDTDLTEPQLYSMGVMGCFVSHTVGVLTHDPGVTYEGYIENIARHRDAAVIKLFDIADNLQDEPNPRQRKKCAKALRLLAKSFLDK